jgi:hypothetical protein
MSCGASGPGWRLANARSTWSFVSGNNDRHSDTGAYPAASTIPIAHPRRVKRTTRAPPVHCRSCDYAERRSKGNPIDSTRTRDAGRAARSRKYGACPPHPMNRPRRRSRPRLRHRSCRATLPDGVEGAVPLQEGVGSSIRASPPASADVAALAIPARHNPPTHPARESERRGRRHSAGRSRRGSARLESAVWDWTIN